MPRTHPRPARPAPTKHSRHSRAHTGRPSVSPPEAPVPRPAGEWGQTSHAQHGRAPAALIPAVPHADGVTPLILATDLRGLDDRVQLALQQDPTHVVRALFRDVLPDEPVSASGLEMELNHLAPLIDAEVTMNACADQVTVTVTSAPNGFTYLPRLHATLAQRDPHVLPGILAALEAHSTRLTPQFGPRLADELAQQWHHEDRVIEHLMEDHPEWDMDLQLRDVVRLARRSGIPHPWVVRDEMPWTYLRGVPGLDEALARLLPLLPDFPDLWPLLTDLPELREAHTALPAMTADDRENGQLELLPSRAYSPLEDGASAMVDVLDEVMRFHWEGGEDGASLHLVILSFYSKRPSWAAPSCVPVFAAY